MLQNTCDLTVGAVKPVRTLRYDWVSPPPRFIPSIEDPSIEGINMSSVISLMNRGFHEMGNTWYKKNEGNCDYGGISVYTILHIGDI